MSDLADVARACGTVAADGTDPGALAAVVTWACGPKRNLDALRRRIRDAEARAGGAHASTSIEHPAQAVARSARSDGGLDGPLADVALRIVATWARLGVRVTLIGDPAYPAPLAEGWPDIDTPVMLAWRGEPPAAAGPGVAIVGSRNATAYGTSIAELLASSVSRAGGRVVSGGALGIDAAAHEAALGLPGGTTVVLGCGHAVRYPAPHARPGGLFARVLEDGGSLVSELLPEVTSHPGVIRARNRILAGLSVVTVVVEGGHRSGSLLTASAAVERGREVLAVPGDILAPASAAPLRLLSEGARVCTGPRDVVALVPGLDVATLTVGAAGTVSAAGVLPGAVLRALERAGPRGIAVEDLAPVHEGGAGALIALLVRARVAGVVEEVPGGVRLRRERPHGARPSVR